MPTFNIANDDREHVSDFSEWRTQIYDRQNHFVEHSIYKWLENAENMGIRDI